MIPWWVYGLVANVMFIGVEYFSRSHPTFWAAAPFLLPCQVIGVYCLFHAWNGAPHWLTAWAIFTLGGTVLRTAAVASFAGSEVTNWPLALFCIGGILGFGQLLKSALS